MQRDSGTHFDPELLALFIEQLPAMLEIKDKWREPVCGTHFDPELLALFIEQLPAMLEIKDKWREPV